MADELPPREAILVALSSGPASTAEIADALGAPDRSVRRHLRRLAREGYVFSPERGRHRLTALGWLAVEPRSEPGHAGRRF